MAKDRVTDRLQRLADAAAVAAQRAEETPAWSAQLLSTSLFLSRRKLFPEVHEPSPFGRIEYLPGNRARIIPPGDARGG